MILPLFLIIIGSAFLLKNLGYISGGIWGIIWPVFLIVFGIGILLRKGRDDFFLARQNFYWPFWCPKDKE